MKYTFKEMLNEEIYENTRVMFILGKYTWFNNMVADTLKAQCISEDTMKDISSVISDEFNVNIDEDDGISLSSVDFNTFMEVIGVQSINGKWFCKVDLSMISKKQKEILNKYIKEPSENGILVIVSDKWLDYKEYLNNRILSYSKVSNLIQLSFPNKQILKDIVLQSFKERNIEIDSSAIEFFLMRMSSAYDSYEDVINNIVDIHKEGKIEKKHLKVYMKGIENFVLDDFIMELMKPMSSDKTNSKKVLKMMSALIDELGALNLLRQVLNKVNDYIDYRLLINSGHIPVGINFFFKDIINSLPEDIKDKYKDMNEWKFRREVDVASRTSLRDWSYLKLILSKAIEDMTVGDINLDMKAKKALYEACTRSVITEDRVNNIIGVDNIILKTRQRIDRVIYDENKLKKIGNMEETDRWRKEKEST